MLSPDELLQSSLLHAVFFMHWDALAWYAFGTNVLAFGALGSGAVALRTYRSGRKAAAAQWRQDLVREFYTTGALEDGCKLLEYDFEERLAPILELRVLDRSAGLRSAQREDLRQVDVVLNYFESLLYLESERHLKDNDRAVFFQYWFDLMDSPDRGVLRRYLARCGYDLCTAELKLQSDEYLVIPRALNVDPAIKNLLRRCDKPVECVVRGARWSDDLRRHLVNGSGWITGDLIRVPDISLLAKFDGAWGISQRSLEVRDCKRGVVRVWQAKDGPPGPTAPFFDAWAYVGVA
jgi:hypothetical protein